MSSQTEACLIIFWWKDCPVGHIEVLNTAGKRLDFEALSATAVTSDVLTRAQAIVDADTFMSPSFQALQRVQGERSLKPVRHVAYGHLLFWVPPA